MEKIKTREKRIAKSLKSRNPITINTFKAMAFCLFIYDSIYLTNHFKNIKALYFNYIQDSVVKISDKVNTENRTLTRYRNTYLQIFDACEFALKFPDEIFDFLN